MNPDFTFFEINGKKQQIIRGSLHLFNQGRSPWVIFCHGLTGQRMGPGYLYVKISRALAEAGISSARFDFRGSGESDGTFFEMNLSTMNADLIRVLQFINNQYQPSATILLGHSFGGLVVSSVVAQTSPEGLILLSPVGDVDALIEKRKALMAAGTNSSGFYELGPHEMTLSFVEKINGIDPVDTIFTNFHGELLLFQGDNDSQISVQESARYLRKAEQSGIKSDYHLLHGADHNFSRVSDVKILCTSMSNWIKERFR
ncbi:MAG: lysophospholipase [Fibrobacter sp.]|nr:lysophospholipase [Fibrobacter sp.]